MREEKGLSALAYVTLVFEEMVQLGAALESPRTTKLNDRAKD
jgi:hypothetical protein